MTDFLKIKVHAHADVLYNVFSYDFLISYRYPEIISSNFGISACTLIEVKATRPGKGTGLFKGKLTEN